MNFSVYLIKRVSYSRLEKSSLERETVDERLSGGQAAEKEALHTSAVVSEGEGHLSNREGFEVKAI